MKIAGIILFISLLNTAILYAQIKEGSSGSNEALTPLVLADINEEAQRKVTAFENYLITITDKTKSAQERNEAINTTVGLFLDEEQLVEVSYPNPDGSCCAKTHRKIRDYLNRLRVKPTDVNIKFTDLKMTSDFKLKNIDETHYIATITFWQDFEEKDLQGNVIQKDRTKKDIEIHCSIVRAKVATANGYQEETNVKLGKITVAETLMGK